MTPVTVGQLLIVGDDCVYLVTEVDGEACGLWWIFREIQFRHLARMTYSSCFAVSPEEWQE